MEVGIAERRRFERDLHDSAQQRLVALRIQIALSADRLPRREDRAMLEELGADLDIAIDDLRNIARGLYPQRLATDGVTAALRSATAGGAVPVTIEDAGLARHAQTLELAIYFCCLEALQNTAKHAGPGARAVVRLREGIEGVHFSVEDDGVGFEPTATRHPGGLTNLRDRVAAVGGTLQIRSAPGRGTRVSARIPL
jgi:signal transduction histidine kinase